MGAYDLKRFHEILRQVNAIVWGPPLLFWLMGTGLFLLIQLHALPVRRLFFALRAAFGREARSKGTRTETGVSPFASLMTELAAEIGTGNIVGDRRHLQNKLGLCVQPFQFTDGFGIGPHAAQVRDIVNVPLGKGNHLFHDLCNRHHLISLKAFSAPLVFCGGSCKDYTTFPAKAV